MHQLVDEGQFRDDIRRQNEWIKVRFSHATVDRVHRNGQRDPGIDQPVYIPRLVGIEVDYGAEVGLIVGGLNPHTERGSHFQRIDNVQIMRPCLGEIFPRVRRSVAADISIPPGVGSALRVVGPQRLLIILAFVAK